MVKKKNKTNVGGKPVLTPVIKLKSKLKKSGYHVWSNNGKKVKQGLEANVELIAVKNEYAYLIQLKRKEGSNSNQGVRGLQEVAGHSDFIIPTYVYPEEKRAINLRTRLEVLKEIWNVERG